MVDGHLRPQLRLEKLEVRNVRSIREICLPSLGLGWKGNIPDTVVLGGANGSGKSTLLSLIAAAPSVHESNLLSPFSEGFIQFSIRPWITQSNSLKMVFGSQQYVENNLSKDSVGYYYDSSAQMYKHNVRLGEEGWKRFLSLTHKSVEYDQSAIPSIVYFGPKRDLVIPDTEYKAAGKVFRTSKFVTLWHPPERWADSFEATLYSARWEDLNESFEGRPNAANKFSSYAAAFEQFFGGRKSLIWQSGALWVKVNSSGELHSIQRLSSGEQQLLLLCGEILRLWKPGSLVMIDEPELHLHSSWQLLLWNFLTGVQSNRGGQLIVATHSEQLFEAAGPNSRLLLPTPA